MIPTQSLLNSVAYPTAGQNVRRKFTPLYDLITIAAGTTNYNPFQVRTNIFANNQIFPLRNQIFALTNISLYLQTAITTTALYAALLTLLQQSYLKIDVDQRTMLKIPLLEILSYNVIPQFGTTTVAPGVTQFVKRSKNLILPIVINSMADVKVTVYTASAAATAFDTGLMNITFNGVMLDKIDPVAVNLVQGNQFNELAWTLFESLPVSVVTQNIFNFFANRNQADNLFSGSLPLSDTERFEIQAIEVFMGGNAGATDTINLVRNNRINNNLVINVEQVEFYNSNLENSLSLAGAQDASFKDTGGTITNSLSQFDVEYGNKILEIPLLIPAVGNVQVQLTQPGSSLNSGQYITTLLKGKKVRQVI